MNKLVFFLGPAGAGKTTLAKAIASRRKIPFSIWISYYGLLLTR